MRVNFRSREQGFLIDRWIIFEKALLDSFGAIYSWRCLFTRKIVKFISKRSYNISYLHVQEIIFTRAAACSLYLGDSFNRSLIRLKFFFAAKLLMLTEMRRISRFFPKTWGFNYISSVNLNIFKPFKGMDRISSFLSYNECFSFFWIIIIDKSVL